VELKNISANGAPAGENLGRRGGQSIIGDEGWVGLEEGPSPGTSGTERWVESGGSDAALLQ
jgi:hypothetical protein